MEGASAPEPNGGYQVVNRKPSSQAGRSRKTPHGGAAWSSPSVPQGLLGESAICSAPSFTPRRVPRRAGRGRAASGPWPFSRRRPDRSGRGCAPSAGCVGLSGPALLASEMGMVRSASKAGDNSVSQHSAQRQPAGSGPYIACYSFYSHHVTLPRLSVTKVTPGGPLGSRVSSGSDF